MEVMECLSEFLKESLKDLEKYDNVLLFEKLELCLTRIQKKNPGSKIVRR